MKLPSAEDFLQIIDRKTPGSLATLHNYRFIKEDGKNYWHIKSRNVIVFKAELNSTLYAIRFFLHDDIELFKRYHEIEKFLFNKSFSWQVPIQFLNEEFYPAVRMDWVDGYSLSQYIDSIISNPSAISLLQSKLADLSASLEENGVAHGNLNLKHIKVVKQGQDINLKLIDYDSMFIPAFKGKDSVTAGTASFQHPMRLASDFSETIDRFSFWIFLTALEAFKINPSLWTKATEYGYDQSKQLLFNYRDLAAPQQSRAFQIIKNYNNDALNFYADKLIQSCTLKSLDNIEAPRLYGQSPRSGVRKERDVQETKTIQEVKKAEEITVQPKQEEQKQKPKEKSTPNIPVILPQQKTVLTQKIKPKQEASEKKIAEKKPHEVAPLQTQPQSKIAGTRKKNKIGTVAVVSIATILILGSLYFIKAQKNPVPKTLAEASIIPEKPPVPKVEEPKPKETVFTSGNITQFLFQLYQSYNKRDLPSILSNYADSLQQYYNAGPTTKNKLTGVIDNLFISPAYYECKPDLRTLYFKAQDDRCTITISVSETIQTSKRSKKENYSSKIEYTINRAFKILSEKSVS